jgi:hypothetical protein
MRGAVSKVVGLTRAGATKVHQGVKDALARRRLTMIRVPALLGRGGTEYTLAGLMLVFFAQRLGQICRKEQLIEFLRRMGSRSTDPQPRHFGLQHGFNFLVAGCYHPVAKRALRTGEYALLNLTAAHPSFQAHPHPACKLSSFIHSSASASASASPGEHGGRAGVRKAQVAVPRALRVLRLRRGAPAPEERARHHTA